MNKRKLKEYLEEKLLNNSWEKTYENNYFILYEKTNKIKNYICQISKVDATYKFYHEYTDFSLFGSIE